MLTGGSPCSQLGHGIHLLTFPQVTSSGGRGQRPVPGAQNQAHHSCMGAICQRGVGAGSAPSGGGRNGTWGRSVRDGQGRAWLTHSRVARNTLTLFIWALATCSTSR